MLASPFMNECEKLIPLFFFIAPPLYIAALLNLVFHWV